MPDEHRYQHAGMTSNVEPQLKGKTSNAMFVDMLVDISNVFVPDGAEKISTHSRAGLN